MEGPKPTSYREWDQQLDNAWFRWGRQPPHSVMAEVHPLTAEYAGQLWRWIFPTDEDVLPLVAKDKKGWLTSVFDSDPIRFDGFQTPPLEQRLPQLLPWRNEDDVFFLVRRGTGYHTLWRVYVKHWQTFLGWYSEGLLFHPTAREVLVFWEVNAMYMGRRRKRRLSTGR